ncbi:MAG: UvrD-helicase domain-containing protein [Helicobacteraceae bacterium]|nr:UvrD-helicase domain-containing protein [Helicobacteraceae bacterium]
MLKYPHFIGAIQEFVDKYLAYPALRHLGYKMRIVDTELAKEKIEYSLMPGTKTWLSNQYKAFDLTLTSLIPLTFRMPNKLGNTTATYQDLYNKKKTSLGNGYFFYDDMYACANHAIEMYPDYVRNVRGRFPLVFIDEAQDNNTQDVLIERLFNDISCIYQRFSDSYQAIYDFHNANGQNTFGNDANRRSSINIGDSKRFPAQHLGLINQFKLSTISMTALSSNPKSPLQIITYSETTKSQIILHFLGLVDTHFEREDNPIVKIVGFVGQSDNPQNHIGSYIENYKKTRKSEKSDALIELVHTLRANPKLNMNKAFYQILGFIIKKHEISYENDTLRLQKKSSIGIGNNI